MDHRELFKTRLLTKNDKQDRKSYLQTKRTDKRADDRFARRNIKMEEIFASTEQLHMVLPDRPVPVVKKQQILNHLNGMRTNKRREREESRPPFITVVPIGKYIEPLSTTALEKRVLRTNQKLESAAKIVGKKEPDSVQKKKPEVSKSAKKPLKAKKQLIKPVPPPKKPTTQALIHSTTELLSRTKLASAIKREKEDSFIAEITGTAALEAGDTVDLNLTQTIVLDSTVNTPELNTSVNRYLSPYVSVSRGKGSAKREILKRESFYKITTPEDEPMEVKENREAAFYFDNCLDDEIKRLNEIADGWETYKNETIELEDEQKDMIDVAVGQTRLLIANKFKQFRTLIEQCRTMTGEKRIYPQDLEGFWTMLHMQCENLDERFKNLDRLKSNNWVDPDIMPVIEKKSKNKRGRKKKAAAAAAAAASGKNKVKFNVSPRSEIKNFMKNFKLKKMQEIKENLAKEEEAAEKNADDNVEFHLRTTRSRRTLLISMASAEKKKPTTNSPRMPHLMSDSLRNSARLSRTPANQSAKKRGKSLIYSETKNSEFVHEAKNLLTERLNEQINQTPTRRSVRKTLAI